MPRGDILDRNGEPLARTIEAWTIGVHPGKLLGDKRRAGGAASPPLPAHDEAWYYAKLTLPVNFTYLERHASPASVNAVHALGKPGLAFAPRKPERLYPQSTGGAACSARSARPGTTGGSWAAPGSSARSTTS